MISLRKSARALVAALTMLCAVSGAAWAEGGQFKIAGTDIGGGNPYSGRVSTDIVGNTVKVTWDVGGSHYTGIGILIDDSLAVYFTGPTTGVALYHFDRATGAFFGKWTVPGAKDVGSEDWYPIK